MNNSKLYHCTPVLYSTPKPYQRIPYHSTVPRPKTIPQNSLTYCIYQKKEVFFRRVGSVPILSTLPYHCTVPYPKTVLQNRTPKTVPQNRTPKPYPENRTLKNRTPKPYPEKPYPEKPYPNKDIYRYTFLSVPILSIGTLKKVYRYMSLFGYGYGVRFWGTVFGYGFRVTVLGYTRTVPTPRKDTNL